MLNSIGDLQERPQQFKGPTRVVGPTRVLQTFSIEGMHKSVSLVWPGLLQNLEEPPHML